ncbi:ATP-NAD kinase-like domain [Pseudocohnilembus persalinus]|uniref:ATP-NAD kinase-like domain n=1 Tax=Pseudocohnilembus persalinus TaxID=266149 RepID=A0A0V0R2Q6_PSEPJ|nr:ATP-NAD kinase-like domain [Pseudocohnilembus persalinus]|eukprot:KRX08786.1 ATP-NAD kinase-like domain [Pseudocohnilembus persalinus]
MTSKKSLQFKEINIPDNDTQKSYGILERQQTICATNMISSEENNNINNQEYKEEDTVDQQNFESNLWEQQQKVQQHLIQHHKKKNLEKKVRFVLPPKGFRYYHSKEEKEEALFHYQNKDINQLKNPVNIMEKETSCLVNSLVARPSLNRGKSEQDIEIQFIQNNTLLNKVDTIVSIGGDGTLNDIINGLLKRKQEILNQQQSCFSNPNSAKKNINIEFGSPQMLKNKGKLDKAIEEYQIDSQQPCIAIIPTGTNNHTANNYLNKQQKYEFNYTEIMNNIINHYKCDTSTYYEEMGRGGSHIYQPNLISDNYLKKIEDIQSKNDQKIYQCTQKIQFITEKAEKFIDIFDSYSSVKILDISEMSDKTKIKEKTDNEQSKSKFKCGSFQEKQQIYIAQSSDKVMNFSKSEKIIINQNNQHAINIQKYEQDKFGEIQKDRVQGKVHKSAIKQNICHSTSYNQLNNKESSIYDKLNKFKLNSYNKNLKLQ